MINMFPEYAVRDLIPHNNRTLNALFIIDIIIVHYGPIEGSNEVVNLMPKYNMLLVVGYVQ